MAFRASDFEASLKALGTHASHIGTINRKKGLGGAIASRKSKLRGRREPGLRVATFLGSFSQIVIIGSEIPCKTDERASERTNEHSCEAAAASFAKQTATTDKAAAAAAAAANEIRRVTG